MQDLIEQERFEMEVLEYLNSGRFLRSLVFCGGTMLRLCHGLNRFSVDLDFWIIGRDKETELFEKLHKHLSGSYYIRDAANKFHTLLFEIRSPLYPRSLKIEVRKANRRLQTEKAIAYSPHSTRQVLVQAATLSEIMAMKTAAFLDRGEIRDVYDMEFLVKRGVSPVSDIDLLHQTLSGIENFAGRDYAVKLGSVLAPEERKYYQEQNFRILKAAIQEWGSGLHRPRS